MKKTRYPIMNMGTISILTIFIILCMVTFAALTYISTRRDASFTDRLASRTSGYYAAVSEAVSYTHLLSVRNRISILRPVPVVSV